MRAKGVRVDAGAARVAGGAVVHDDGVARPPLHVAGGVHGADIETLLLRPLDIPVAETGLPDGVEGEGDRPTPPFHTEAAG